jgi:hypothetical protein
VYFMHFDDLAFWDFLLIFLLMSNSLILINYLLLILELISWQLISWKYSEIGKFTVKTHGSPTMLGCEPKRREAITQ